MQDEIGQNVDPLAKRPSDATFGGVAGADAAGYSVVPLVLISDDRLQEAKNLLLPGG